MSNRPVLPPAEVKGGHDPRERKVIEADEIRVGSIRIVATDDGTAGIWFGDGHDRAMIALFSTPTQVGVGIYAKGAFGPTDICLAVDEGGVGYIQFAGKDGGLEMLTLEDVRRLHAERTA